MDASLTIFAIRKHQFVFINSRYCIRLLKFSKQKNKKKNFVQYYECTTIFISKVFREDIRYATDSIEMNGNTKYFS